VQVTGDASLRPDGPSWLDGALGMKPATFSNLKITKVVPSIITLAQEETRSSVPTAVRLVS
jgi:hypothetical protein